MPTLANIHGGSTVAQNPQLMGILQNVDQIQSSQLNQQLLAKQYTDKLAQAKTQAKRTQQFNALAGKAFTQAGAGLDYNQTRASMVESNPELALKTFDALGAVTQSQKDEMATFAFELSNTPNEQREAAIMDRASKLKAQGRDPQHTLSLIGDTPEDQDEALQAIQMAALTPAERIEEWVRQEEAKATVEAARVEANANLKASQVKANATEKAAQLKAETDAMNNNFDRAKKIRGEIASASKDFKKVKAAYNRIESLEPTPIGDMGLIFNFINMLDPTSTVRTEEYDSVEAAASVPERLKGQYEKVLSGKSLTVPQREDILRQSGNLYKSAESNNEKTVRMFVNIGKGYGVKKEQLLGPEEDSSENIVNSMTQADINNMSIEEMEMFLEQTE